MSTSRAAIVVLLVGAFILTGCSSSAGDDLGEYPDLRLVDTKSPVQLVRNTIADTVPRDLADTLTTEDASIACLAPTEDDEGLIRSWRSSATFALPDEIAGGVDGVIDALAEGLVAGGWSLSSPEGSSFVVPRTLSRESSEARVEIVAVSDDPDARHGETTMAKDVRVVAVVTGPCVRTDGAGSDEVMKLGGVGSAD